MQILTAPEQNDHLESTVQLTLDNFSLASLLTDLLIKYKIASIPSPRATVRLEGQNPLLNATIPGENCGFFVTPVVQMAALDCRRSLEFFGLTCDYQTKQLKPITQRRSDDLGIEHFGLQRVPRDKFLQLISTEQVTRIESILVEIHKWSNKQLAHFTISKDDVMLPSVHDGSIVMIEAYLKLLFDALGKPRPRIQPSND